MTTVLLIEDDPFLIDIYNTKLKDAGFEIDVAENGERAIEKLKEKVPDILLLDIVLPYINGWRILEEIQKMKKEGKKKLKKMKIIIISNLGQKEEIEKGIKLGATKYLIKAHYTPSEIVEEIKKLM